LAVRLAREAIDIGNSAAAGKHFAGMMAGTR
jgi:hypothetical protein